MSRRASLESGHGNDAHVGLPLYQLLLYVDDETFPQKLSWQLADFNDLIRRLQQMVARPIVAVSYWDEDFKQYVGMRSLQPLRERDFKSKIMVETGGIRITPVLETRDSLEFAAIRDHVDKLSAPRDGHVYQLTETHRIVHPDLEDRFQTRRKKLRDPSARTMMLFYTNNARPSEQVVQHGFALPQAETRQFGGGIAFASDIEAQPSFTSNLKFLLCEVAVGQSLTIHSGDARLSFDAKQFDSLLILTPRTGGQRLEEWAVFDADQAIPRYIITCNIIRGVHKYSWNVAAMGCDQHPGESLRLWCVTCRRLICPYCMTIGAHRGHDAKDTSEVAVFEKQVILKMFATLESTITKLQNEIAEFERVKSMQSTTAKKCEEEIHKTIDDLHKLLDNEEVQLFANLDAKKCNIVAEISRNIQDVQARCAELQRKSATLRPFLELPIEMSLQSRMEFLYKINSMLELLQIPPRYDDPMTTTLRIPELPTQVAFEEARTGIQTLTLTDVRAAGVGAPLSASVPRVLLDGELNRLKDIESGYIWVIPNAVHHFALEQTKDVFSDIFTILGMEWEIRITPQPADHISVFIHAANHIHRMDFKIILFSPKGWYVRQAKNWMDGFKGRGWGIKPYCDKKTLLEMYVVDGVVKMCVTPTSGLY